MKTLRARIKEQVHGDYQHLIFERTGVLSGYRCIATWLHGLDK
jgi:hypothetical protein